MRGFYMFEGAFWQGGGGWEYIEVSRSVSELDEGAIWEDLAADVYETELEAPQDIQAWVDWAGVALPELVPPVLPEGCGVVVDKRELRYGRNSTFDGCGL